MTRRQANNDEDPDELDKPGLSPVVDVIAGGMAVRALIDSGATTNLLHIGAYKRMPNPPLMTSFAGNLLLTNGKKTPVVGRTKIKVKVGSINDELPVLMLDEMNPELIIGSRTMEEFGCSLDFDSNQFWTGKGEGSAVPVEMIPLQDPTRFEKCQTATEADDGHRHDQTPSADCLLTPAHATRGAQHYPFQPVGSPKVPGEQQETTTPTVTQTVQSVGWEYDSDVERILQLTAPDMEDGPRERLRELVCKYRDVFALRDSELGTTDLVEHHIVTTDSKPIKIPAHRISPAKLHIVEEEVTSMLERGVIQSSSSPYSAPIVLVKKKDGSTRFCVDYRALNSVTIKDAFPIPKIAQTFDALRGAKFFSSMDLASGYWQVPIAEEDRHKTAFVTPDGGLYEYLKMPFGLPNAPGTFQRLMNELFRRHLWKWELIFLDDVLVYRENEEDHLQRLEMVFQTLRQANLKLKPKKCRLFQKQVVFLSHVISADGVSPDPEKVSTVSDWPVRKTVKQVRSFVGFCNYHRRFIKDFAKIAQPLHELTKKQARFNWTVECQLAFDRLRFELTTAPMLQFPKYDSPFIVDTDASNESLGAVLSNIVDVVEQPIVYASRTLSRTEANYSTTEREALAVVQSLKWFRPYVWGLKFIVRTDHASLHWLFRQNSDGQTFRMLQHLQEYDFQVVHRAGNRHANAGGLSRMLEDELPEWQPGKLEEALGTCPEPKSLEKALKDLGHDAEPTQAVRSGGTTGPEEARITWSRTQSNVRELQEKDEAIAQILYWVQDGTNKDRPSLGTNLVTRAEATKYGEEVLGYWSHWDELLIKDGLLYRRKENAEGDLLQLVVPGL